MSNQKVNGQSFRTKKERQDNNRTMMKGIGKGRQAEGMDDRQSDRPNVRRKGKIMTGQTGKRKVKA